MKLIVTCTVRNTGLCITQCRNKRASGVRIVHWKGCVDERNQEIRTPTYRGLTALGVSRRSGEQPQEVEVGNNLNAPTVQTVIVGKGRPGTDWVSFEVHCT